jgi:hypothetical protein
VYCCIACTAVQCRCQVPQCAWQCKAAVKGDHVPPSDCGWQRKTSQISHAVGCLHCGTLWAASIVCRCIASTAGACEPYSLPDVGCGRWLLEVMPRGYWCVCVWLGHVVLCARPCQRCASTPHVLVHRSTMTQLSGACDFDPRGCRMARMKGLIYEKTQRHWHANMILSHHGAAFI